MRLMVRQFVSKYDERNVLLLQLAQTFNITFMFTLVATLDDVLLPAFFLLSSVLVAATRISNYRIHHEFNKAEVHHENHPQFIFKIRRP